MKIDAIDFSIDAHARAGTYDGEGDLREVLDATPADVGEMLRSRMGEEDG